MQSSVGQHHQSPAPATRGWLDHLQKLLSAPVSKTLDSRTLFWFTLSCAFSVYFASLAMQQAFSSPYVLQDDARQHIFWAAKFVDADLFPHDLITDYFQAIAPTGYTLLYRGMASLGVDPLLFSKLLPMVLGLMVTGFCFAASMRLLPVPSAAFVGSFLLNQSLWMRNGLVSATPRAFTAPLFVAFIYFQLRGSRLASLITIALMGLFFPSIMFVAAGTWLLQLIGWENRRLKLSRDRREYLYALAVLATMALVLLPYAIKTSSYGPVVTGNEARTMPEFLPKGRMAVYKQGFWDYWFTGSHTGMFSSSVFYPLLMGLGLLLPGLLVFRKHFPLVDRVSRRIALMPRAVLASLVMFAAANVLLFRLYLPSRFTVNSFRILLALAAGLTAIIILDTIVRWAIAHATQPLGSIMAIAATGALAAALFLPQILSGVWVDTRYKTGEAPQLYEWLARTPKDALIASLSNETDNLPVFAKRSILVGREIALPFHRGYYGQIRQRAIDLIHAQYSADLADLQRFIQTYGVTYLLVDRDAFTADYVTGDRWLRQFQPAVKEATARLEQGITPALAKLMDSCAVFEANGLVVISADSVLRASLTSSQKVTGSPVARPDH